MDRISDLPDGIIIKILSFLPIDKAASSSILSKRWRDLFVLTPNLHLSEMESSNCKHFMDFVERVLAASGDSAIRSFTLKCRDNVGSAHTDRWIRNVLKRGGVLDLDLKVTAQDSLLLEVFACKTLVNLKLNQAKIPMLPVNASLPALKSLSLDMVGFDSLGAFEKLISACPLLEEFNNSHIWWPFWKLSLFLSGPTLKRLSICCYYSDELGSMSFDYPNLVYLEYSAFLQLQYPVVNLDSLVEAKLDIFMKDGDLGNCDPSTLIKGLRNVKFLSLSFPETVEIFEKFHEAVPVLEKLIRLSIIPEVDLCLSASSLPSLLKKCPNLQTLVIEGPLCGHGESISVCGCFSENSPILSSPVKVLELTKYKGSTRELGQIKRFLEELSCLELVKVSAYAKGHKKKLRITTDLLMLPRASSKCRIQVHFSSRRPY